MKHYSVFDPAFRRFGQVLEGYDFSTLFRAAGTQIKLYATTLHYAPCSTTPDGYRVLCVLPRGTNGPRPDGLRADGEDRLCMGANKWLIAHPQSPEALHGAFIGLHGENLTI